MNTDQWKSIKHFKVTDNWGDVNRISVKLVDLLDEYRSFINTPINVNVGTQGTHVEKSEHYLGLAVDICFPEKEVKDLFDLFLAASRFDFNGIGIYPGWHYNGKVIGGMHLDIRDSEYRKLWIGVDEHNHQVYEAFNSENLKKYGFLA